MLVSEKKERKKILKLHRKLQWSVNHGQTLFTWLAPVVIQQSGRKSQLWAYFGWVNSSKKVIYKL